MSETLADQAVEPQPPASEPLVQSGIPIAFAAFANTLRPRQVPLVRNGVPVMRRGRPGMTFMPGHPDQIWLRLVRIRHGGERHTETEWMALIDAMRDEPAHPSHPRYGRSR